jgi:hypothetical protein
MRNQEEFLRIAYIGVSPNHRSDDGSRRSKDQLQCSGVR